MYVCMYICKQTMHVVCLVFHPSVDSVAKMVGLLFFVVSVLIIASIC